MINNIKTVVILGSSGTIGSLTGGLIAQKGIKVYFLSRSLESAKAGLKRAMVQTRSEVTKCSHRIKPYKSIISKNNKGKNYENRNC